jgi:Rieske Fe-S protein
MDDLHRVDRRRFLTLIAGAAATAACSGGGDTGPASFGDVSAGNISNILVGSLRIVGGDPVVIGRDSGGLYAMTITCTHQGCDVEPVGSGSSARLDCPCHGSEFDRNGGVIRGPAKAPLAHFSVTVDGSGNVTIHGGVQVDANARTPVA